jgi:hypothetical protein
MMTRPFAIPLAALLITVSSPVVQAKQQCSVAIPPHPQSQWWSYRLIDGRKCWYEGKPGLSKDLLEWPKEAAARPASVEQVKPAPVEDVKPAPAEEAKRAAPEKTPASQDSQAWAPSMRAPGSRRAKSQAPNPQATSTQPEGLQPAGLQPTSPEPTNSQPANSQPTGSQVVGSQVVGSQLTSLQAAPAQAPTSQPPPPSPQAAAPSVPDNFEAQWRARAIEEALSLTEAVSNASEGEDRPPLKKADKLQLDGGQTKAVRTLVITPDQAVPVSTGLSRGSSSSRPVRAGSRD